MVHVECLSNSGGASFVEKCLHLEDPQCCGSEASDSIAHLDFRGGFGWQAIEGHMPGGTGASGLRTGLVHSSGPEPLIDSNSLHGVSLIGLFEEHPDFSLKRGPKEP